MLTRIYADDPHQTIAAASNLEVESTREINLESTLQFTSTTGSAYFDFSAYLTVSEDGSNLAQERQRLTDEIRAFDALAASVNQQHADFRQMASAALLSLDQIHVTV